MKQPILTYEGMVDDQPPVPGIETVTAEALDKCIESLCEVIRQTLASKNPSKFTEVERYCRIGHNLIRTRASSVDEFLALGGQIHDDHGRVIGGGGGGAAQGPILRRLDAQVVGYGGQIGVNNVQWGGNYAAAGVGVIPGRDDPMDAAERQRRLVEGPRAQVGIEIASAEIANAEAEELERLVSVRDKLPEDKRKIIEERIATLLASVEVRNHAHAQRPDRPEPPAPIAIPALPVYQPADGPGGRGPLVEIPGLAVVPVVPADVPRGHPADAQGPADDVGACLRANGHGGQGARHLAQEGDAGGDLLRVAMGG